MLVIGGFLLSQLQKNNEQKIAIDHRQDATLQACIDRISTLILDKDLQTSNYGDKVRDVARAQILTAFRGLDGARKGILISFLQEL